MRELEVVLDISKEAGEMLAAEVKRPGGPRGAGMKAPIDNEIEHLFIQRLRDEFPDDAVISEETQGRQGRSGRAFIIDPHDGTRDFLEGRRETSISVALVEDGDFLLGLVYAPMATELTGPQGMLLSWARGDALRYQGEVLSRPPRPATLSESSVVFVSPRTRGEALEENKRRLSPASVQACPSIATRCALVALGRADAGFTLLNPLSDWDFAGAQALLRAVGGDIYGPDGAPIRWRDTASSPQMRAGYFAARHPDIAATVAERFADITGGR